ncbi:MAG TPA: RIP metalloprotease RseP [Vicinamibacteria bacterium]|nr:RIP metalloprotease RseP [Vicinamibacteria bacterium]
MQSILPFIVVLGVIIFVHEFGHFIVAKSFGMRVFIFSFGFGRRLLGVKWGDTDYRISLIPLGGYVKLEGEPEDHLSDDTTTLGDGKDFTVRPRWQRIAVYLAGPAMNAVLTIGVMTVLYMIGFGEPASLYDPPLVGVVAAGSPAEAAGLKPGDLILTIDGKPQPNWQSVLYSIALRPSTTVRLQVRRDGETRDLVAQSGVTSDRIGTIGIGPTVRIQEVRPGTPAEQAGLKVGDAILKVGDKYIAHADDVSPAVQATEGREIPVQISRAAQTMTFPMVPARQDGAYRIGITVGGGDIIPRKFGPAGAFVAACRWSWERTQQIGEVLGRLLTARLSPKTVAGPLGIAQESGKAARSGPVAFFLFLAFISLNVGLLNLFPLPPLDGGHLAILAGESVIRRDFSATVKAWILNAGAVAILLLVALVLYSDFSKISLLKKFLP